MAKKPTKIKIVTEILQNGELIDRYESPLGSHPGIKLSGKRGEGQLFIPQYAFTKPPTFIRRARKGRALLCIPQDWSGFFTSLGEVHDVRRSHAGELRHEIGLGDYGSLSFRDLNFLFKIESHSTSAPKSKVKPTREYRGSLYSLLVKSPQEWPVLLVSLAISLFIWGCFTAGLLVRPDDLPKTYGDLPQQYVLPFLDSDHLRTIPEANQRYLDRRNYIKSTLDFYRSYSQMVLGYDISRDELLFPNSIASFQSYYNKQQDEIIEKIRNQSAIDEEIASTPGQAILRIPAVKGTSASHDLQRLIRTIEKQHLALQTNLEKRREFKYAFTHDKSYKMNLHQNIAPESDKPIFGKISLTGNADDETLMYMTAEQLAEKADRARQFLDKKKAKVRYTRNLLSAGIAIPGKSSFSTFIDGDVFQADSTKLNNIIAAEYNPKAKVKIKEPLTGELDPSLVSRTIDKKKFELQLCYELALRRDQKASGKMEFAWRIDSRGKISDLQLINSTIHDQRMVSCIKEKISTWQFPRPQRGSVKIRYPFSFKPRRG